MKSKTLLFIIYVIIGFALPGCMQNEVIVSVNTDGSGTVTKKILVRKGVLEQMEMMATADASGDAGPGPFNLFSDENFAIEAGRMGEGVKFLSADPVEDGNYKGVKAVFSFEDITELKLHQNENRGRRDDIIFSFTPGPVSTLEIKHTSEAKGASNSIGVLNRPNAPKYEPTDEEIAGFRGLFQGANVSLSVVVNGVVRETNATYHDSDKITIMSIDFDKLLASPGRFETLVRVNPKNVSGLQEMVEEQEEHDKLGGIKVDMNDEILIRFKGDSPS